MSLDRRCQQFHEAASGTCKSKGPVKEISTLRKFLHNNQDQRLSDKATSRLFDTIQIYVCNNGNSSTVSSSNNNNAFTTIIPNDMKESLLEDSLKMPFTIFNTKQKQKMLKWLEEIRGQQDQQQQKNSNHYDTTTDNNNILLLSVIDCNNDTGILTLMFSDDDDDESAGDTYTVPIPIGDLGKQIQERFETTESVLTVKALFSSSTSSSNSGSKKKIQKKIEKIIDIIL